MGIWELPPLECKIQGEGCLVLPLLRSSVKKASLEGMPNIHPTCAICNFFAGEILNEKIKQLREALSIWRASLGSSN